MKGEYSLLSPSSHRHCLAFQLNLLFIACFHSDVTTLILLSGRRSCDRGRDASSPCITLERRATVDSALNELLRETEINRRNLGSLGVTVTETRPFPQAASVSD